MGRLLLLVACCALVAAGCSGEPVEQARTLSTPTGAVADWLGAVAAGDVAAIATATEPANVALVAAAENRFTVDQLAAVAESGLPDATASSYWATFGDGFADFLGVSLDAVSVNDAERFQVGEEEFAAVTIGVDDATTEVITHLTSEGWKVDLVATSGPTLAVQIRRLVTEMAGHADQDIARIYVLTAARSLDAAHVRAPNRALELELDAIEELSLAGDG